MATTTETAATPETTESQPVRPARKLRKRNKPKRQPRYAVVLHNDDINGMDYVVGVLQKVFHYGQLQALRLMFRAHFTGHCVVWSGSLEVAELKADQLRSCGPDPSMKDRGATTLRVSVEPLPG